MGSLTLPEGGLVYLDANSLIYTVERVEPYRSLLDPMWQAAQRGDLTVASGRLIVVESLVKPLRDGNRAIEAQYREIFKASVFRILDIPLAVYERAAKIRAFAHLKTADTLQAATALDARCALFITSDADSRRVEGLPTVVLRASLRMSTKTETAKLSLWGESPSQFGFLVHLAVLAHNPLQHLDSTSSPLADSRMVVVHPLSRGIESRLFHVSPAAV